MTPYNEFIHIKNQDQPIITGTVLVKFCSLFQIPALLNCECFSLNIFSSEFRTVICWATGPRDGPDHPECLLRWCKVWRAFLAGSVPLDFQQLEIDNMKCGIVWRSRTFLKHCCFGPGFEGLLCSYICSYHTFLNWLIGDQGSQISTERRTQQRSILEARHHHPLSFLVRRMERSDLSAKSWCVGQICYGIFSSTWAVMLLFLQCQKPLATWCLFVWGRCVC